MHILYQNMMRRYQIYDLGIEPEIENIQFKQSYTRVLDPRYTMNAIPMTQVTFLTQIHEKSSLLPL